MRCLCSPVAIVRQLDDYSTSVRLNDVRVYKYAYNYISLHSSDVLAKEAFLVVPQFSY